MKLKKVKFNNHQIFADLEVDFTNKENEILKTTVVIGNNGSGKTSLLKSIYELLNFGISYKKESESADIILSNKEDEIITGLDMLKDGYSLCKDRKTLNVVLVSEDKKLSEKEYPKVIFMPTEINFNMINKVDNRFKLEYKFCNEVNQNITQNIPSFIATKIYMQIFKNKNLTVGESIDKVCEDINYIFRCMELDVKLIGLSEDEDMKPVFKDKLNNEFDISKLSSGEKQLFLRALSLKFLNANNSIILIDEPEISLHPEWQRKIIKVYEGIGENNQLIIATHSPHVVGDIKSEQLRVIKRDENGVSIVDNNELEETYGHTVESILVNTMKLTNTRNDEINNLLNEIRTLLRQDLYESDEFKSLFKKAKQYLGTLDQDIVLINMDIKRRQLKRIKDNAKD